MPRKILHLDLDAFFCAVEEKLDPSLRGKAFAVGGRPDERGVVASCSYAARRFGVHSAMPMSRALRLCPEMMVISSRHRLYGQESRQVMERLQRLSPLVEQISIDEAFLDVSDLSDPGELLARRLQAQIRDELGLPCSLGIATNKLVAKTATDVGKAANRGDSPPNAITVVPPGEEAAFLAPLPVQALWGVGPKTADRLAEHGIRTIGDLALYPEVELARLFGKLGRELSERARGLDDRPVVVWHEAKSISQETTFARDTSHIDTLLETLRSLSENVGKQLRKEGLCGSTIRLKIRWPDFTTLTRQTTVSPGTDQDSEIYATALRLFESVWRNKQPVRLIGVGVSGLGPPVRQLSFWDSDWEKEKRLLAAVDQLKSRFGEKAVQRGKVKSG
jgi:DNA polymerase IV